MDRTSRIMLRKIILDFFCLIIVGVFALVFYLFGKPYKRGFFCNDESLNHPFQDSTVTSPMLYVIGVLLPVSTMMVAEYLHARNTGQQSKVLLGFNIPAWVWTSYCKIGLFGFGAFATILTTDVGKYTIGRLRPHFMKVCVPSVNCSLPENHHQYIEDFVCTAKNLSPKMSKELRLSFPSGHSSFSFYAMVYLVLYLELRFTWKGSKLLKNVLQFICLLAAWFTALTRVSNYKHHWSDVLAGSVLGTVIAVIVALNVADLFKERRTSTEKLHPAEYEVEDGTQKEEEPLRITDPAHYGGINN
ncbi:putative phosphatidate phosphatase [Leptopilina heterotoma]|uniref:putative phosphatidate phosphatase n=1 Tax=Leptopilina heterotoma TaxID=63436 RepID=UPI001CA9082C|nr:putative phosphatidate phosphatase [Leptopilina heterotoma]